MKRYAVVAHHQDDQDLKVVGDDIIGKQPIHDLVSSYHWFRLDEEHIMVLTEYPVSNHNALHSHEKVSMLPHVNSNRTIHAHIQKTVTHKHKDKHWNALKNHVVIDESTNMEDAIDLIVAKHGPLFAVHT